MSDKKRRLKAESITELQEILDNGCQQTLMESIVHWMDGAELSEFVDFVREEVYGY